MVILTALATKSVLATSNSKQVGQPLVIEPNCWENYDNILCQHLGENTHSYGYMVTEIQEEVLSHVGKS